MKQQLYIGSNGHVAAIEMGSGVELWRTKLKTGMMSATAYQDVAVLDHEEKVYAGCHGHLFCLDAASGEVLWHNQLEGMGYNDITMSIAGRSVQIMQKVHHQSN